MRNNVAVARLEDGRELPYVVVDNPPRGNMKYTYFAPDKSYVIQFYNRKESATDTNLHSRLNRIITRYNPTLSEQCGGALGNSEKTAAYFSGRFCWPTAIVQYPEFGIVCPAYPQNFLFEAAASQKLQLEAKEKKSNWFTSKNRQYLQKEELGDFKNMLRIALLLSRSVRRMHTAGLAHSDLSNNNVLIDPKHGDCVVIDIDSLVVPKMFPPEVAGTRGYVAPEVLETMRLDNERRKYPSRHTDLHALAVLIYQYIFARHPLLGPKIYSAASAEEDDFLALGELATFIEHPEDTSNRPEKLRGTIEGLGSDLWKMFLRAFVTGLHAPENRPSALEWEQALLKARDLLYPCTNPSCEHKYFILTDYDRPVCPFCGRRVVNKEVLHFKLFRQSRSQQGEWSQVGELNAAEDTKLYAWHMYANISADEKADASVRASVCRHEGRWLLVNCGVDGMVSPGGNEVPQGQAILLEEGTRFRTSRQANGMMIEVEVKKL